jgi:hypothetical protein
VVLGHLLQSVLADLFPLLVQSAGNFQCQGLFFFFQLPLPLAQVQLLLPEGLDGRILFFEGALQFLQLTGILPFELQGRLFLGLGQAFLQPRLDFFIDRLAALGDLAPALQGLDFFELASRRATSGSSSPQML